MNLFMVNIYTNILVVLPLRKILQRVDHLVNEIEHAESQSQSSLVFCAFFNSRFFAQMKTIILEFCSLYLILQVRNYSIIFYFIFRNQNLGLRVYQLERDVKYFKFPKLPQVCTNVESKSQTAILCLNFT